MSPTPEAYELHLEHLRKGVHADAPRVVNVDAEVPGWTKTVAYVEATWLVHRIKFVNAWVARHGALPYGDEASQVDVRVQVVQERKTLSRPSLCPADVWAIASRCFAYEPSARPSFAELEKQLR